MIKNIAVSTALALVLTSMPSLAFYEPYKDIQNNPYRLRLGVDVYNRDVRWTPPAWPAGAPRPEEDGTFMGIRAGYDFQADNRLYVGVEGRWSKGDASSSLGDTDNVFHTLEARIGHSISMAPRLGHLISFYLGLGLSGWTRDAKDVSAPEEDHDWVYVGAGVRGERTINRYLRVGFNAKIMFPVDSDVEVKLLQPDGRRRTVDTEFGERVQFEFEVPIEYKAALGPFDALRIVPYYYNTSFDAGDDVSLRNQTGEEVGRFSLQDTDIDAWGATIEAVSRF